MVSAQTVTKHAKECLALYKTLYEAHLRVPPEVNSYRDLWGFRNMVEERGLEKAKEAIYYYFDFEDKFNQNLIELFREYDKFLSKIEEKARIKAADEQLRIETGRRAREWKEKNGAGSGTTS